MNVTSAREPRTLAWMTSDGVPKGGNHSGGQRGTGAGAEAGKGAPNIFLSGALRSGDGHSSALHVLLLDHDVSRPAAFACRVSMHGHQAAISHKNFSTTVDAHQDSAHQALPDPASVSVPPVAQQSTRNPVSKEEDDKVRTGSVLQPTVVETGFPMYAIIMMLVFMALLILVITALLLQKFRERCIQQPGAYPSPYVLAGDGLEAWGDRMGQLKGSRRSLHTVAGLRSHYSLPRPLQPPPPPPPKLHRSKSRESGEYAGSPNVIPGMTRSFHYTTPYDAIVHDEDGELSLLNMSSHCDVTPALPPEQAFSNGFGCGGAESAYKIPRCRRAGDLEDDCSTTPPQPQPPPPPPSSASAPPPPPLSSSSFSVPPPPAAAAVQGQGPGQGQQPLLYSSAARGRLKSDTSFELE